MFSTPVLFLIFNRPDTTIQVFEQIRKIKPAFLYVAADGPRSTKPGESETCQQVRSLVLNGIDWDCKLITLIREENLGCGRAVSEAISWFFGQVEEGIILEDDTVPDLSFFRFCEEMLQKYKTDDHIIAINGCNFNFSGEASTSYFLSKYMNVWGWATWKRVADKIDYNMRSWNKQSKLQFLWSRLRSSLTDFDLDWFRYWRNNFDAVSSKKIDTWDYQWQYHQLLHNMNTVVAGRNLVINLGFGEGATHTTRQTHLASNMRLEKLSFPLQPLLTNIDSRYETEVVKPVWHMLHSKPNSYYLLNSINTLPFVQTIRKKFKI
ncbi:MAG: nucleotide-diphospho-sugar transferase [Ferruginibacter sp.]|nr:nucleotide-diphospho-sugar transferase [Ferruginibacter sp.]